MFRTCLGKLERLRYRRRIKRALALHVRGEVRTDGLDLISLYNRLDIQWRARDIHPWDRDVPEDEKTSIFVAQSMADTEAAILRLFAALPQVDVIGITVLGRAIESPMIAGTVRRADLETARGLPSIRMRLKRLGITDYLPLAG
jgi:hypothetical protein